MSQTRIVLMEAIARKQVVATQYNGAPIRLAPHLLFERHGELFVQALNLGKTWRSEEERRLGQFKLAGLVEAELLEDAFDVLPAYDANPPRPEDVLVLAV